MKGIVFSQVDIAGKKVFEALVDTGFQLTDSAFQDLPVYERDDLILASVKEDVIQPSGLDELASQHGLELIVMASRHKSESGRPTLTVHPTGNYGDAQYGGRAKTLQKTSANTMRNIFLQLIENPPQGYSVSLEATHHGPTGIRTPLLFAELGSSEKQWTDTHAASFLADAIVEGLKSRERVGAVIGIGGGHYAPKFSDMETDLAFGHICPSYAVDGLDEELVKQMIELTSDGVEQAVLDEKSLKGRQKALVKGLLQSMGIEF